MKPCTAQDWLYQMGDSVAVVTVIRRLAEILVAGLCLSLGLSLLDNYLHPTFSVHVPRVLENGKRRFNWRTRWLLYTDADRLFHEAYEKHSKFGRTCLIPFLGLSELVVTPQETLERLGRCDDNTISLSDAAIELLQARYTAPTVRSLARPWRGLILKIRNERFWSHLAADIENELAIAFESQLACNDSEWMRQPVHHCSKLLVSQITSAFTVGRPLCRDQRYNKDTTAFGECMLICSGIINHLPRALRPVLAPVVCIPIRLLEHRLAKKLGPVIDSRIKRMASRFNEETDLRTHDRLQMMLEHARKQDPTQFNVGDMTARLIMANFGAMHQTSIALTNLVLNVASSDAKYDTIRTLRKEVEAVLRHHGGRWTKEGAAEMVLTDSAIRETLRLHGSNGFVPRSVTAVDGIITNDGVHLPRGTIIAALQRAPHLDPENFPNPHEYDPFRFSGQPATTTDHLRVHPEKILTNPLIDISLSLHMAFGFGKHACPGRFLVDIEIKMLLAHLLMHYDLRLDPKHDGLRPPPINRLGTYLPPSNAYIEIRKRRTVHVA